MAHNPTDDTRRKVTQMSAVGIPQEDIALVFGITKNTLRKHYKYELKTASIKANAAVAGKLYEKCMAGDTASIIFWCKTRLGMREKVDLDHSSKDGSMTPKPFPTQILITSPDLDDDGSDSAEDSDAGTS